MRCRAVWKDGDSPAVWRMIPRGVRRAADGNACMAVHGTVWLWSAIGGRSAPVILVLAVGPDAASSLASAEEINVLTRTLNPHYFHQWPAMEATGTLTYSR